MGYLLPILVFLGLSVLDLGPVYATDRQTDVRQHYRLMPRLLGAGHNKIIDLTVAKRSNRERDKTVLNVM